MKLLVTGAGGFLGQAVVDCAVSRSHQVRAMIRPAAQIDLGNWRTQSVEIVRHDLRFEKGLPEAVAGAETIVHLAADKSGSFQDQFSSTVRGTENLLNAMLLAKVPRIVLISTLSVYSYSKLNRGAILTEESPIEDLPDRRDNYCQSKLIQEGLVREFSREHGIQHCVLRPGVIYGPDNLWTANLGTSLKSNRWLRIGAHAKLPLTFVRNCAEAIAMAAELPEANGATINIIDDNSPTQREYLRVLRRNVKPFPRLIPLNYSLMMIIGRSVEIANIAFFSGKALVPQIARPHALAARCKPLRYSNKRAKQLLRWSPRYSFEEAIQLSLKAGREENGPSSKRL